eukprot:3391469-Karenia_brevis.AAC.1
MPRPNMTPQPLAQITKQLFIARSVDWNETQLVHSKCKSTGLFDNSKALFHDDQTVNVIQQSG